MLDYLPNEIITHIFSYLTIDEIIQGRIIAKRYREIIMFHQLILIKNPFTNKKYLKNLCTRFEVIEKHWQKIPIDYLLKLPKYFATYGSNDGFKFCLRVLKSIRITDYITLWSNNGHNCDLLNDHIVLHIIDKLRNNILDDTILDYINFECAYRYGKAKEWIHYKYNLDRIRTEDMPLIIGNDLWKEYIIKATSGLFEQENVWIHLSRMINTERLDIIEYILNNVNACYKYFMLKTVNPVVVNICMDNSAGESIDFLFEQGRMDLIQVLTNANPLHYVSLLQIYLERKMYDKAKDIIYKVNEISKTKGLDFPVDAVMINVIKYAGNLELLLCLYDQFYGRFPEKEVLNVCRTEFTKDEMQTFDQLGGILMYSDISGSIFNPDNPTLEFIYRTKCPQLANQIDEAILIDCNLSLLETNTIEWLCQQIGKDKLEKHMVGNLVESHLIAGNYDKARRLIEMGFSMDKTIISYGLGLPCDTKKSISMIRNEIKEILAFLKKHSQPLPTYIINSTSYYHHYQYSLEY